MAEIDFMRTREELLADMQSDLLARVPDAFLGDEGVLNLIFNIMAGVLESVFLSLNIVAEDTFVATANPAALDKHGEQFGLPRHLGLKSSGSLLFTGRGGTVIPMSDTEVAYDPGTGEEPLYFITTGSGTIPNPGIPTAPVTADAGAGGMPAGTYEYAVTFVTAAGETALGLISAPLVLPINRIPSVTIPLGGPGTIARHLWRRVNSGAWYRVTGVVETFIANNTATSVADGTTGLTVTPEPAVSTAEAILISAESEDSGASYNVMPGTITTLTDVPDGVTAVTNLAAFTGGTDPETTEAFRVRLQNVVRSPGTGSPTDLKSWAEAVEGVETATVFANDNLGTPTNGHVTVRISGVGGSVPSTAIQNAVTAELQARDIANITIHVTTFTSTPTAVSVTITPATGYVLADVSPAVTVAITNYINALGVGETLKIAGIISAVFGLPGVGDVVVTSPASNQATGVTAKRTPGTITVS